MGGASWGGGGCGGAASRGACATAATFTRRHQPAGREEWRGVKVMVDGWIDWSTFSRVE